MMKIDERTVKDGMPEELLKYEGNMGLPLEKCDWEAKE